MCCLTGDGSFVGTQYVPNKTLMTTQNRGLPQSPLLSLTYRPSSDVSILTSETLVKPKFSL